MITFIATVADLATMSFGVKQIFAGGVLAVILATIAFFVWIFFKSIKDTRDYNSASMPTLEELNLTPMTTIDTSHQDDSGFDIDGLDDFSEFDNEESEDLMKQINAAEQSFENAELSNDKKTKFGIFKK